MNFGKNIKKIRSIKKLSQSAFAEIFGITRSSIGAYEEGRAEPKLDIIIRIAKHFSISVDSLINSEITVNELSHFHLLDEYLNAKTTNENLTSPIEVSSIALIGVLELKQMSFEDAEKKSKNKISLPGLNPTCVSVLIDTSFIQSIPKCINNNDIIVVNPVCDIDNLSLKNKYCLIKIAGNLSILEVEQINENKYLLHSSNKSPAVINKNEAEYILPIEKHISNVPMVIDNASEKIKKLELMVNDLYNRLE